MKSHFTLPAVCLLTVVLGSVLCAPPARADGGFVMTTTTTYIPDAGGNAIPEPEQHGVLLFRDGVEDLYLDVRYQGNPDEFAWLVPCPTRPQASIADPAGIHEVYARLAAWRPTVEVGAISLANEPFRPARPHEPDASIWDLTVLPPERAAVQQWIRDHGLEPSTHAREVLDSYVRHGWYFVGMSIGEEARGARTAELLHRGRIQPVHLRFSVREPVFPLRISSINPGFSDVDLYVYTDQAVRNRTARWVNWDSWTYGPSMPPRALDPAGTWNGSARPAPFLTRLRARFHAWEMQDDVYFAAYDPDKDLRAENRQRRLMAIRWIRDSGGSRWEATLRARLERPGLGRAERAELLRTLGSLAGTIAPPPPAGPLSTDSGAGSLRGEAWVSTGAPRSPGRLVRRFGPAPLPAPDERAPVPDPPAGTQ